MRFREIRQWNRLFDQHYRDVVFNRIQVSAVFSNEAPVNGFLNGRSAPVAHLALCDAFINPFNQSPTCQSYGCPVFRAGQNIEQFLVNHLPAPFRYGRLKPVPVLSPLRLTENSQPPVIEQAFFRQERLLLTFADVFCPWFHTFVSREETVDKAGRHRRRLPVRSSRCGLVVKTYGEWSARAVAAFTRVAGQEKGRTQRKPFPHPVFCAL